MPGSVVWKWTADAYRHATGSSMSKFSPREAFAEWCHPPPRNSVECGKSRYVVTHVSSVGGSATVRRSLTAVTVINQSSLMTCNVQVTLFINNSINILY